MRRIRVVLAFSGLALALTGCAPHPPVLATGGDTYAVVDGPASASGAAGVTGTLVLDENNCWALTDGGETTNIIWPDGTYIDDGKLSIAGIGTPLGEGAPINGGGGGGSANEDQLPCWSKGDQVTYLSGAQQGAL